MGQLHAHVINMTNTFTRKIKYSRPTFMDFNLQSIKTNWGNFSNLCFVNRLCFKIPHIQYVYTPGYSSKNAFHTKQTTMWLLPWVNHKMSDNWSFKWLMQKYKGSITKSIPFPIRMNQLIRVSKGDVPGALDFFAVEPGA